MDNAQLPAYVDLLSCPICRSGFVLQDGKSLVCGGGHCYDIAKQGYVHFFSAKDAVYTETLFENRHSILEAGFYQPFISKLEELLSGFSEGGFLGGRPCAVLDAGCGEGFYLQAVGQGMPMRKLGFDLSKEAVKMAAKQAKDAFWMATDIGRIPVKDGSMDFVLNLFSPANYAEFGRVLKKDGILIKALPGSRYLIELRRLAGDMLKKQAYDNKDMSAHFKNHMHWLRTESVCYTLPVNRRQAESLARMTPMLSHVDIGRLPFEAVDAVTMHIDILLGRKPEGADL